MPLKRKQSAFKALSGTGFAEVAAGFILVMLVLYLALDLFLLVQGATLNSELVKEAARAASMGPPGKMAVSINRVVEDKEPPYKRVMQIVEIKKATLPSAYEISPEVNVTESVNAPLPVEPFGGPIYGNVTVETTIVVHPQFLGFFKLEKIGLNASRTCPYTWIMKSQTVL